MGKARGGSHPGSSLAGDLDAGQSEWLETLVRMLGPLRPMRVRRFERAKELIELLGRASTQHEEYRHSTRRGAGVSGIDTLSEALEAFDPDLGASGRPRALSEYVPGKTAVPGSRKQLRKGRPGKTFGSWIRLDRGEFELGDSWDERLYRFPIDGSGEPAGDRRTAKGVAELVWFEALVPLRPHTARVFRERVLLLLDGRGFRLAVVENIPFTPEEVFQLARAAKAPAAAYRVRCLDGQFEEILGLMFPRRRRARRV
jgi:hypothetical protein